MPFSATDIRDRVLYCDRDILVLDKPTGLPVHAGTKIQQHLEELLDLVAFDAPEPPRLAHRLDKDTSGCLVMGRHAEALVRLGRLFAAHRVDKLYWAVVIGRPPQDAGRIDLPLLKIAGETGARMEVDAAGKSAITDYAVLATAGGWSWLALRPHTGRTHQLRAHCAALGCPIIGDAIYGPERPPRQRLHLHARAIRLPYDPAAGPLVVMAPVPAAMAGTGFDGAAAAPPFGD
ncbi:MAG: RNA pseudouridine synthase [Azospirillaceae bacterium]|nr:RNA pseudouridine synthase [Azospirillaceae bacterium]